MYTVRLSGKKVLEYSSQHWLKQASDLSSKWRLSVQRGGGDHCWQTLQCRQCSSSHSVVLGTVPRY